MLTGFIHLFVVFYIWILRLSCFAGPKLPGRNLSDFRDLGKAVAGFFLLSITFFLWALLLTKDPELTGAYCLGGTFLISWWYYHAALGVIWILKVSCTHPILFPVIPLSIQPFVYLLLVAGLSGCRARGV